MEKHIPQTSAKLYSLNQNITGRTGVDKTGISFDSIGIQNDKVEIDNDNLKIDFDWVGITRIALGDGELLQSSVVGSFH